MWHCRGGGIGTGTAGFFIVRQPGGVAGTDELQISHDGSHVVYENKDSTSTQHRFYTAGNLRFSININGTGAFGSDQGGAVLASSAQLNIGISQNNGVSFGLSATSDGFLLRNGAAGSYRWGTTDAASPVAQTHAVQNVVAGTTNTAGATRTQIASLGTSQGAPGRHHFQAGALIAASGTTQQTAVDRLVLGATKVLTNNSATTVTNVTVASNTVASGVIDYSVEVFNGTDLQVEVGSVSYMVTNKGGVFSGNTTTKFGNQQNATSGTLAVTWAISGADPAVLSVNANSSLTPSTGYPRVTYNVRSGSQQAIAIQ